MHDPLESSHYQPPWVPLLWTVDSYDTFGSYNSNEKKIGFFYHEEFEALCGLLGRDLSAYRKHTNDIEIYVIDSNAVIYGGT